MERQAIDEYIRRALAHPFNDCQWVAIDASDREGGPGWECIGVHLMTGAENGGNHNIYIEVVDAWGKRVGGQVAQYDWVGKGLLENAPDTPLDKPETEPAGNIPIGKGQTISTWIKAARSDVVEGLTTDVPGLAEEPGSTWGHRSYLLIFCNALAVLPVPPVTPPPVTPPPAAPDCTELINLMNGIQNELETMTNTIVDLMVRLGYWSS